MYSSGFLYVQSLPSGVSWAQLVIICPSTCAQFAVYYDRGQDETQLIYSHGQNINSDGYTVYVPCHMFELP